MSGSFFRLASLRSKDRLQRLPPQEEWWALLGQWIPHFSDSNTDLQGPKRSLVTESELIAATYSLAPTLSHVSVSQIAVPSTLQEIHTKSHLE